jgi:beta-glucuronidase
MKKPRRTLLYALAAIACAAGTAAAQTPGGTPAPTDQVSTPVEKALYQDGQKGRFLLDGNWYFRADAGDQGLRSHFARQQSVDGWSPVTVPNAWNATDQSDQSDRGSIGWYRKDFNLPRSPKGTTWVLRFESVNYRATVFINGKQVDTHEGAFIPFEIPVGALKKGVNRLVVRVDSRRRSTDIPPARDQANGRPGGGWWNYGGILREVYLRQVKGVDVQGLHVMPVLPCATCDARVKVTATVVNPGGRKKAISLRANIGGLTARFRRVKLNGGATAVLQSSVLIKSPRLWQPGDPELYHARVQALLGRHVASQYDTDFGVRSIKVDSKGRMLLNGRPVQLRGASMHEDSADNGGALTQQQLMANVDLLSELGATVTRSHYPLHPLTMEECDKRGILVWEQIPFNRERFASGGNGVLSPDDAAARSQTVRTKALGYLRAAIDRDQNHPSVFAWSVANEPDPKPGKSEQSYFSNAIKIVRKMDPTRLAAVDLAGYPSMPQSDIYARFDALGLNSYFGWYPGPSGELEDRAGLRPFLDQMHDYYPHTALFVTEFGAEANRNGPIDEKGTYDFQDDLLNYHLDQYDTDPYVNGAIIWILKDFSTQPGWDGGNPKPSPPYNAKGLVDINGNRKPAFADIARRFRDTQPFR